MATILFAAYFIYFAFKAINPKVWHRILKALDGDKELK